MGHRNKVSMRCLDSRICPFHFTFADCACKSTNRTAQLKFSRLSQWCIHVWSDCRSACIGVMRPWCQLHLFAGLNTMPIASVFRLIMLPIVSVCYIEHGAGYSYVPSVCMHGTDVVSWWSSGRISSDISWFPCPCGVPCSIIPYIIPIAKRSTCSLHAWKWHLVEAWAS